MVKEILFKTLGLQNYLRALHKGFHFLYSIKVLKNDPIYKYHYFDVYIIREGDCVLDIGANLGYYTKLFAKWVGKTGSVYAVEPIPMFADIIKWGTKRYNNVKIYNYALGTEEREVEMGAPGKHGFIRSGLFHVVDKAERGNDFTFKAQMKRGSRLFEDLPKLDFIKCDIEGYEEFVLPEMEEVIKRHKPAIQLETWGDHRPVVEKFLKSMGYEAYELEGGMFNRIVDANHIFSGDTFFIHKNNPTILNRLKEQNRA